MSLEQWFPWKNSRQKYAVVEHCVGHEILEAVEDGYVEEAVGEAVPYLVHNQYSVDLFADV